MASKYDYDKLQRDALSVLGSSEPTLVELADELKVPPHIANKTIHKLRRLAGQHRAAIVTVKKEYQGQTRYRLTADLEDVAGWRLIQSRGIATRIGTIRSQMSVELTGTSGRTGYGRSIRRAERMLAMAEAEFADAISELEEQLTA